MLISQEQYQREIAEYYQRELRLAKASFAKKDDKSLRSVHRSIRDFYKRLDKQIAGNIEKYKIAFACQKGCGQCCTLRVEVFGYEVGAIAKHIHDTMSENEISELTSRLAEASEKSKGLTMEEHFVPCALLKGGECSIYSMRPAMCRKFHSLSSQACLDNNQGVENRGIKETTMASIQGFVEGARQSGLRKTLYELNQALHVAIVDPLAGRRWLGGVEEFTPIPEMFE